MSELILNINQVDFTDGDEITLNVEQQQVTFEMAQLGPQGPQGATGPQGPTGPAGVVAATAPVTYNAGTQTVGLSTGSGLTTSAGSLIVDSTVARRNAANAFTVGGHSITNAAAAVVPLTIQLAASQSANSFELKTSTGSVISRMDGTAFLHARGFRFKNGAASIGGVQGYVEAEGATVVPLILRGAASQTANLTEWQDFAGNLLASVNQSGFVRSAVGFASTASGLTLLQPNYDTSGWGFVIGGAAQKGVVVRGAASQSANLQEWQDSTGTVLGGFNSGGGLFVGTATAGGYLGVTVGSASIRGMVIKGAASQSANLQEWQDSAGTVLAYVTSAGVVRAPIGLVAGGTNTGATLSATATSASTIGAVIRGVASQTANLMEVQNSAGTVLAKVQSSGAFYATLFATTNSRVVGWEENSGGFLMMTKQTAATTNPGSGVGRIYFRDGTNAGTLKLVVRAGAAGAETTILDNIPQ